MDTNFDSSESSFDVRTGARSMLELPRPRHPMDSLLKKLGGGMLVKEGDIVEGEVIEKKGSRLFLDLGALGIGIVYGREYYAAQEAIKKLAVGDRVSAKVVEADNDEGYVELSLQEAGRERRWHELKRMMRESAVVDLPVQKANTGGLILELLGVEGFLPASQLSAKNYPRVDGGDKEKIFQELQKLAGQTLSVKILDVSPEEGKLIFTEKGLEQAALRERLAQYKIGDAVEGEITGVVDFGAFMKFDEAGLEGLIHLSEIDWTLVENPRSVLKVGDRQRAKIIDIQGDKVSLSLKQLKEDPWQKLGEKYKKGDAVAGRVMKFNSFGAFVQIEQEIQGLVHVSEFGSEQEMRNALELGKEYPFTILMLDPKEHRMSLGRVKEEERKEEKKEE